MHCLNAHSSSKSASRGKLDTMQTAQHKCNTKPVNTSAAGDAIEDLKGSSPKSADSRMIFLLLSMQNSMHWRMCRLPGLTSAAARRKLASRTLPKIAENRKCFTLQQIPTGSVPFAIPDGYGGSHHSSPLTCIRRCGGGCTGCQPCNCCQSCHRCHGTCCAGPPDQPLPL